VIFFYKILQLPFKPALIAGMNQGIEGAVFSKALWLFLPPPWIVRLNQKIKTNQTVMNIPIRCLAPQKQQA
jgi:hypothetical protein